MAKGHQRLGSALRLQARLPHDEVIKRNKTRVLSNLPSLVQSLIDISGEDLVQIDAASLQCVDKRIVFLGPTLEQQLQQWSARQDTVQAGELKAKV
jgi:hypothetical protein